MYKIFVHNTKDKAANDKVFGENAFVVGVEVTTKEEAEKCRWNIDPQHGFNKIPDWMLYNEASQSAIEVAASLLPLPPDNAVFYTTRADLDAFGAAAVLSIRRKWLNDEKTFLEEQLDRIKLVAETDKFSQVGGWKPYPLPTIENPWPVENSSTSDRKELAAINAAVMDFKVDPQIRLQWMIDWILTGAEPVSYREQVEAARLDMIRALEKGEIKFSGLKLKDSSFVYEPILYENHDGKSVFDVAAVESTHRAATMVGYSIAPVVLAYHPEWNKYTICQFREGYVNFSELKARLNQLEKENGGAENATWGGSNTIAGSPQVDGGTKLSMDDVLAEVIKLY